MSAKKSQRVNLSHNGKKCQEIISQINQLVSMIRSGDAKQRDINVCVSLTNKLNKFIGKVTEIDEFYRWLATETIEMSEYTCKIYDQSKIDDKI